MNRLAGIRIGDPNRTPNTDPYERTNEENERTESSGYLPGDTSSSVTRTRTYDDSPFPWPYAWQRTLWATPAHTCPDCRRIVVRTDGHRCQERSC